MECPRYEREAAGKVQRVGPSDVRAIYPKTLGKQALFDPPARKRATFPAPSVNFPRKTRLLRAVSPSPARAACLSAAPAGRLAAMNGIRILSTPVGAYATNCHLVWRDGGDFCVLVDPGADADGLLALLDERELVPAAYLLTHGHADHVGALAELAARHPAPAYLAKEDRKNVV